MSYDVVDVDCSQFPTTTEMLREIGRELGFADYFRGDNLDGFDDFMYDIKIPANGGLAIVLRRYDLIAGAEEQRGWKILNIFARHSRRNLLSGKLSV